MENADATGDERAQCGEQSVQASATRPAWEKLSSLNDHELVKHVLAELSALLAMCGVPGKRPMQQMQKLFKKHRAMAQSDAGCCLWEEVKQLIDIRNALTHDAPTRAGLQDRDAYIQRFGEVKTTLALLADRGTTFRSREEMQIAWSVERFTNLMEEELFSGSGR